MAALVKCKDCGHKVSKRADKCPHCGAPVKHKSSGCLSVIALLFVIAVAIGVISFSLDENKSWAPQAPKKASAPMPKYEIVDRDRYDAPVKTQIVLNAVVSGTIAEPGLKQLLQKLYDEARATRGFKYHGGKPTHVFIYLYTSREHFKSGMGQWIAMLSKTGEDSGVDTRVKTELISQLTAKPEVKYGLSESKRKEIFRAIVTAEDRADADAKRMYPLPDPLKPGYSQARAGTQLEKQVEAERGLSKKHKAEVAGRYGITEEQLQAISIEGANKNWPMP